MKVNEIFKSLQGEGRLAGTPTTFIRLQGCNLYPNSLCKWCDTKYAQSPDRGFEITIEEIVDQVVANGLKHVCVTGGEPLRQTIGVLLGTLKRGGFSVEVETNGTIIPDRNVYNLAELWVADIKCPSSGLVSNIGGWRRASSSVGTDFKFVVGSLEDLAYVEALEPWSWQQACYISPVYGFDPAEVWQFCLEHKLNMSLQLHKVVFGPAKVGV